MGDNWGSEWEEVANVVLERAPFTGGTTGKSGGAMWVCENPVMRAQGIQIGVPGEQLAWRSSSVPSPVST